METKFNELVVLLNNKDKEVNLRALFNSCSNLEKLNMLSTISDFLGIESKNTIDTFKDLVLDK